MKDELDTQGSTTHSNATFYPKSQKPLYVHSAVTDSSTNTLTQSQMFKCEDAQGLITAQIPEIESLLKMDIFGCKHNGHLWMQTHSMKPPSSCLLSSIWLLLLLSSILGLKKCQVGNTQGFPQAPIDDPVNMRMPQVCDVHAGSCLKPHPNPKYHDSLHYIQLTNILFGYKQAAQNLCEYLS